MSLSFQYRLPPHFAFHWLSKVVPTGIFKTRLTMVVSRGACKKDRVGFEPFSLDGCHPIELLIVDRKSSLRKLAKVVGSTPTQSIFINRDNYGIKSYVCSRQLSDKNHLFPFIL
jgi:hypothetical protein